MKTDIAFSIFLILYLQIIEKLSVNAPSGEVRLKVLKEISKEFNLDWDSSNAEAEYSKKHEDLLVPSLLIFQFFLRLRYSIILQYHVSFMTKQPALHVQLSLDNYFIIINLSYMLKLTRNFFYVIAIEKN